MKQKNKKKEKAKNQHHKINSGVVSHANDPFFIKKAEESKKFLDTHGFPDESLYK